MPIYLLLGNTSDAADRQGEVFWLHSAQDPGALVHEFTKWDDNPASLSHFAESAVRAYKMAMTPRRRVPARRLSFLPRHCRSRRRCSAPRPKHLPLLGFTTWVRNGTPGWTSMSGMPAFPATALSDEELANGRPA